MERELPRITFSIESRLEHVRLMGASVRGICAWLGMADEDAYLVELAVCEAANNSIRHAYGEEPGKTVEVALEVDGNRIRIEVSDFGSAMAGLSPRSMKPALEQEADSLAEGGRGLAIIQEVMDEVDYTSRGDRNTLTMVKTVAADADTAA